MNCVCGKPIQKRPKGWICSCGSRYNSKGKPLDERKHTIITVKHGGSK